jgi:cobalt-zinc-cadmium efflux system membrane fusion protein
MNINPIILALCAAAIAACSGCDRDRARGAADSALPDATDEIATGPHGGRLLTTDDFGIELAIFEAGIPPEFRAWVTVAGRPLEPAQVDLAVELTRLGGAVDRIGFAPSGEYLRGDREIYEPHSFDVRVRATRAGRTYEWAYESYEGRTTIPADVARTAGIETTLAGPGVIVATLSLYGVIAPDATRVRKVQARFPGAIRAVHRQIGDAVRAGEALATIESNESLQTYTVTAPIAGVVTERHAEPGEQAGVERLFEIADFSTVWAELSVFPRDQARVRQGQTARITGEPGGEADGTIDYLAPFGDRDSQSLTARIVLDNADRRWTPGQFVEAAITIEETPVDLAVPLAALQTFRDLDVVFARFGDTYEVRMLTLGRRDAERAEVRRGLIAGTEYVIRNSYLVKADIEKSGASHDH